jgi:hypothetical protein
LTTSDVRCEGPPKRGLRSGKLEAMVRAVTTKLPAGSKVRLVGRVWHSPLSETERAGSKVSARNVRISKLPPPRIGVTLPRLV